MQGGRQDLQVGRQVGPTGREDLQVGRQVGPTGREVGRTYRQGGREDLQVGREVGLTELKRKPSDLFQLQKSIWRQKCKKTFKSTHHTLKSFETATISPGGEGILNKIVEIFTWKRKIRSCCHMMPKKLCLWRKVICTPPKKFGSISHFYVFFENPLGGF